MGPDSAAPSAGFTSLCSRLLPWQGSSSPFPLATPPPAQAPHLPAGFLNPDEGPWPLWVGVQPSHTPTPVPKHPARPQPASLDSDKATRGPLPMCGSPGWSPGLRGLPISCSSPLSYWLGPGQLLKAIRRERQTPSLQLQSGLGFSGPGSAHMCSEQQPGAHTLESPASSLLWAGPPLQEGTQGPGGGSMQPLAALMGRPRPGREVCPRAGHTAQLWQSQVGGRAGSPSPAVCT